MLLWNRSWGMSSKSLVLIWMMLIVLLLVSLWHFTALRDYADARALRDICSPYAHRWWIILVLLPSYFIAHAFMFPSTVLNAAVILTFGGILGWSYAITCSLSSACLYYCIGHHFGVEKLHIRTDPRLDRVRKILTNGGIGAVIIVRLLPIAPYSVVNTVAGSIHVKFSNYIIGTFIAHLPGTVSIALLGEHLLNVFAHPTKQSLAILVLILLFTGVLARRYAHKHIDPSK